MLELTVVFPVLLRERGVEYRLETSLGRPGNRSSFLFNADAPSLCQIHCIQFRPLSLAVRMLETLTLSTSTMPKSCIGSFSFGNNVVFSEVPRVEMNWRLCPLSTGVGASRRSPLLSKRASSWCLKVSEWGSHSGDSHASLILGYV